MHVRIRLYYIVTILRTLESRGRVGGHCKSHHILSNGSCSFKLFLSVWVRYAKCSWVQHTKAAHKHNTDTHVHTHTKRDGTHSHNKYACCECAACPECRICPLPPEAVERVKWRCRPHLLLSLPRFLTSPPLYLLNLVPHNKHGRIANCFWRLWQPREISFLFFPLHTNQAGQNKSSSALSEQKIL